MHQGERSESTALCHTGIDVNENKKGCEILDKTKTLNHEKRQNETSREKYYMEEKIRITLFFFLSLSGRETNTHLSLALLVSS